MRITDTTSYSSTPLNNRVYKLITHNINMFSILNNYSHFHIWQEHFAVGSFLTVPINKAQYKMHLWYTLPNILMS